MSDKLQSVDLPAGKVIGGCRVQRLIGRGGMGEVYLAHHLSLDKLVALKILPPSKIDRDHVGRFLQEARVCARIEHPNVVPIYNVGEEAGNYFIVMQFVEGKNLAEIVQAQGGPLPWRPALKLFRLAAKGVAAVHQRGVIHRDIKPSNIMVSNESRVLLMDFGLARDESHSELTRTGALLGTPAFMSPEQCLDQPVDRRSDIYSLGGTLYYLLTGGVPFQGSVQSVLAQIGSGQTPPAVHRVNPYVPIPVSDFVAKAMAFRPNDRFAEAAELARVAGALLSSPELSGMPTAETADMSGLSTSIKIVPELAPVELIAYHETEDQAMSVPRGLLWGAGGVLALLFLVALALTLNLIFGEKATRAPRQSTNAVNTDGAPRTPGDQKNVPQQGDGTDLGNKAGALAADVEPKPAAATTAAVRKTGPVDTSSMVFIPAGKARLGEDPAKLKRFFATEGHFPVDGTNRDAMVAQAISQYDEPRELVDVGGFWIDKYEVTNIEYSRFIKETGHRSPSYWNGKSPPAGSESEPVTQVNYDDATAFANWAGKQLPTVAQWMRAFRGEKDQLFPWGDEWDAGRANVRENRSFPTIAAVEATPRDVSPSGVYNMVGAVRELMRDQLTVGNAGGTPVTATVIKGSDWSSPGTVYGIGGWRLRWVGAQMEAAQIKAVGFRCVWEADESGRPP